MVGGVAVADGDGVVLDGVEVDDDAFWGADFVLLTIALADVAGIVPSDSAVFGFQGVKDCLGFGDEVGLVL